MDSKLYCSIFEMYSQWSPTPGQDHCIGGRKFRFQPFLLFCCFVFNRPDLFLSSYSVFVFVSVSIDKRVRILEYNHNTDSQQAITVYRLWPNTKTNKNINTITNMNTNSQQAPTPLCVLPMTKFSSRTCFTTSVNWSINHITAVGSLGNNCIEAACAGAGLCIYCAPDPEQAPPRHAAAPSQGWEPSP